MGAVLGHVLPNGNESTIAYNSRTLLKPERNYRQADREAFAINTAVKKNQYFQNNRLKNTTGHNPLLGLFNPNKPLSQMVLPRLYRWSLVAAAYDYELEYRQGKQIANTGS